MIASLRQLLSRVSAFFRREPLDRDLNAEMASHIDLATEENLQHGLPPEEARRQALIRFGGVQQAKEQQRDARGFPKLEILMQDLRYTLRTLRRDSGFTVIAVLILALGIGANIVVFNVVDTILLRPLPFHDPQQLTWIADSHGKSGLSSQTYSVDAYREFQRENHSFQAVTAYMPFFGESNYKLTGNGEPQPVSSVMVAGNFFQTLGVQPVLGRLFSPEELLKGGGAAVLLSYPVWQRQFAADPAIVGKAISLNNQPVTVVGVLPSTFDFGSVFSPGVKMDIYVPAIMDEMSDWGNTLSLIGRLKPGVSVAQAQSEANILFPRLPFNLKHPEYGGGYAATITGLKEHVSGEMRRSLIVLWCAVGLILLIVCVNLANLMLARAATRSKEFALRSAFGATRRRLIRQMLTESLLLSIAGAVLGLGFAFATTSYVAHQGSIALPLLSSVRVDRSALAWTMFIAVAAAALFGIVPGIKSSDGNLQDALKDRGPGMSTGRKHERLRAALVVSEVALACVLLIGAGLLLRSFLKVLDIDLGFQPGHAAALTIDYDDGNSAAKRSAILQEILRRAKAIPGIQAAGISDMLPLDHNRSWGLSAKGRNYRKGELPGAFVDVVTPGYLDAMGMHLREGRDFGWQDSPNSQPVVILNQTAARQLWPGEDPVGRIALVNGTDTRVIGVVSDVRETSVVGESSWQMYVPTTQAGPAGAELVVRTTLPPDVLAASVMSTLRSINPGQPATEFRPIQQLVDHAVSPRRFFVLLVAVFAMLGLILASLGIYGVISYSVTRQTQEIGIRMALGASRARVQFNVIAKTLRLVLIGIAVGTITSLGVAILIASLLFATAATDPVTFASVILLLMLVALVAGYMPAWRASRIEPMIALRNN
ncbi:MAG: ABC transporter permease [Acidobacteriaceae bacterium]